MTAKLEQQVQACTTQLQIALTKVEQQSQQIELIKEIVQLLLQGVALDELLQTTVDLLSRVLAVNCCFSLTINSVKSYYFNQSHPQDKDLIVAYSNLYNSYQDALSQGNLVTLPNFANQGVGLLVIPILIKNNLLGVLVLRFIEQRTWSGEEITFVQIIANHCAIAIAHSQESLSKKIATNYNLNQQLEEKVKLLSAVVNSTPDGLYLLDRDKRFIYVNRAILQLLRREEAEVLGKTGEELGILPETMNAHNARLERVFANGQPLIEEIDYIHSQTGLKHYANYNLTPIFNDNNWIDKILVTHRDITDLKQTEIELLKSDERFSKAFHGNPIASSIATFPEARLLNVNTSWLQVFGYSREEVLGRTTLELGVWNSLNDRNLTIQHLQEIGAIQDLEIRFCTKSGEVRNGLMNGEIIDLNGECCILVMLLDITERKRAEVTLFESEQKYRNLVETAQGMIWSIDTAGKFTFVNQAVRNIYGYEPEEMIGRAFNEFTTPEQKEKYQEVFERVLAGESLCDYEAECLRKNGSVFYLTSNALVLRDDAGNVLGIMGTSLDVTHFKQTEAALRVTHSKLSTILDHALAVIINFRVFADKSWEYDYFSSGAEIIYGYTPEELIADKYLWLSRVVSEDVETIFKTAFDNIFAEQTTRFEYQFRHKDETLRWNSFTMFSKRDEAADCWVVTTVDVDISDRKLAEKKLKASLQEKEALLKEVHHRVKNNLQVISSLLDFQAQHIQDSQALESFQESQNRVKSIALIHEKLYQSESLAKVNLADYIHSLSTHLIQTYTLDSNNITLQLRLDEVFCSLDIAIPCGLLINELVANALKHGLPGNTKGAIWVELQLLSIDSEFNRPQFCIIVGNDGIKLSELPRRGSAESVGFQLIYALIQQLNGQIEINQSHGTEFKIMILDGET